MGRLGWILLTAAAMGGGLILHSEDFRDGVVIETGGDFDVEVGDEIANAEERLAALEARLEARGGEEDAVDADTPSPESDEEAVSSESDAATGDEAGANDATASEEDAAIADATARLEQMRDDGLISDDQFDSMVAQLSATAEAND